MKFDRVCLSIISCVFALTSPCLAAEEAATDGPKHNFVCADFAKGEVCVVDQKGDITQVFKTQNPNDVWALPDGEVLFAWQRGVKIYDKAGELKFEWTSSEKHDEIHTCQPLADGNILIAQNGPSRLIEVNRADKIVWKLDRADLPEIKMGFMTGLNRLPNGNTIICFYQGSHHIIEVTAEKKLL